MTGATENYQQRGLIPRAIQHIFKEIQNRQDYQYTVRWGNIFANAPWFRLLFTGLVLVFRIGYLEIYNEQIYDLLSKVSVEPDSQMSIVEDQGDVFVKGLSYVVANNEEDALNLLFEASAVCIPGILIEFCQGRLISRAKQIVPSASIFWTKSARGHTVYFNSELNASRYRRRMSAMSCQSWIWWIWLDLRDWQRPRWVDRSLNKGLVLGFYWLVSSVFKSLKASHKKKLSTSTNPYLSWNKRSLAYQTPKSNMFNSGKASSRTCSRIRLAASAWRPWWQTSGQKPDTWRKP